MKMAPQFQSNMKDTGKPEGPKAKGKPKGKAKTKGKSGKPNPFAAAKCKC